MRDALRDACFKGLRGQDARPCRDRLLVRPPLKHWLSRCGLPTHAVCSRMHQLGAAARCPIVLRAAVSDSVVIAAPQENGVWYVLFSMHSSQRELAAALQRLWPKAVRAFCGAMGRPLQDALDTWCDQGQLPAVEARFTAAACAAAGAAAAAAEAAAESAAAPEARAAGQQTNNAAAAAGVAASGAPETADASVQAKQAGPPMAAAACTEAPAAPEAAADGTVAAIDMAATAPSVHAAQQAAPTAVQRRRQAQGSDCSCSGGSRKGAKAAHGTQPASSGSTAGSRCRQAAAAGAKHSRRRRGSSSGHGGGRSGRSEL